MRRIIDPAKEKIVDALVEACMAETHVKPLPEPGGLDDILKRQLVGLARLTQHIVTEISIGTITKDTPQQLATCIKITMELKSKERELLQDLTDEELEKKLENDNK